MEPPEPVKARRADVAGPGEDRGHSADVRVDVRGPRHADCREVAECLPGDGIPVGNLGRGAARQWSNASHAMHPCSVPPLPAFPLRACPRVRSMVRIVLLTASRCAAWIAAPSAAVGASIAATLTDLSALKQRSA